MKTLLASLCLLSTVPASAAPGAPDPSFLTDQAGNYHRAAALFPDGEIVAAGHTFESYGGLVRLFPDGIADPTFRPLASLKARGITAVVFESAFVQNDGKILAGGQYFRSDSTPIPPVLRFNPDGGMDDSFSPPELERISAILPDGKLLAGQYDFAGPFGIGYVLLRLNPDGSVDPSFSAPEFSGIPNAVEVLDDGRILAGGGFFDYGSPPRNSLVRLLPDGTPDPSFDAENPAEVSAIVAQPDGRLLVGLGFHGDSYRLMRLLPDGAAEPGFSVSASSIKTFQLQTDGEVVLGGSFSDVNGVNRPGLARVTSAGAVDTGFSAPDLSQFNSGTVVIQPDGRILLAADVLRRRLNDPAISSFAKDSGTLRWLRSGAAPEVGQVTFELWDAVGNQWQALPEPSRITGGWAIPSAGLPADGVIRARGLPRAFPAGGGAIEQLHAFGNVQPAVALARAGNPLANGANADLGSVVIGQSAITRFRLRNSGSGVLDAATLTLSGPGASSFAIVEYAAAQLGPQAEKSFGIRFTPAGTAPRAADLTIASNAQGGNFTLHLTAAGVSVVAANFASPTDIPLTAARFNAADTSLGPLTLGFAPTAGTVLTVVRVTDFLPIANRLTNLPDGARITADFAGITYTFIAGYSGGPWTNTFAGNDLTLALAGPGTPRPDFDLPDPVISGSAKAAITTDGTFLLAPSNATPLKLLARDGTPLPLNAAFGRGSGGGSYERFAPLPDGGFVIAGNFDSVNGLPIRSLARFDSRGNLDAAFATDLAGNFVNALAVQPDGKILVGSGSSGASLSRFHPDGSRDNSFAPPVGGYFIQLALQTDGGILVAGDLTLPGGATKKLVRLLPNGSLDPGFDFMPSVNYGGAGNVAQQADGKILVVEGYGTSGAALRRLLPDGSSDFPFQPDFGDRPGFDSVSLQADGKIVIAGQFHEVNGAVRPGIVRLLPDGSTDPGFACDCSPLDYAVPFANGEFLIDGGIVAGAAHPGLARLTNDPAEIALQVPDSTEIRLLTIGAAPELAGVTFDVRASGTADWVRLPAPVRIAGGWSLAGQALPAGGIVRWRARPVTAGSAAAALEGFQNFGTAQPALELRDADGAPLASGIGGISFGAMFPGLTRSLTVTVTNAGDGVLSDLSAVISGPDDSDFSVVSVPALPLEPGKSAVFQVRFTPVVVGGKFATLAISSNDSDPSPFMIKLSGTSSDTLSPLFHSPAETIIRAESFTAAGRNFGTLALAFVPAPGTKLTVVGLTGSGGISGTFADLPDGAAITADFNGTSYEFLAGYAGGDGNDLTLSLIGPGVRDLGWNSAVTRSGVYAAIPLAGGRTLVGGDFQTTIGGSHYLSRLNSGGSADPAFDLTRLGTVITIRLAANGELLLGGQFGSTKTSAAAAVIKLRSDGTPDPFFVAEVEGVATALAVQPDGKIIAAGRFGQFREIRNIVRLNSDGSLDGGFLLDSLAKVTCIQVLSDGKILIGGSFGGTAAVGSQNLARLLPSGAPDPSFAATFEFDFYGGSVYALHVQPDGKIVAAGKFIQVNGLPAANVVRLLPDGATDPDFSASTDGGVTAMAAQNDGKLLLSGNFTAVSGIPRNRFCRIGPDGILDPAITTDLAATPATALALQADGKILASGGFTKVSGAPAPYLVRMLNDPAIPSLLADGPSALVWNGGATFPFESAVVFEIHEPGESGWREIGPGQRSAAGWRIDSIALPARALVRVRSTIRTTRTEYPLVSAPVAFGTALPEISVTDSAGNLLSNPAPVRDFGSIPVGLIGNLQFQVANLGTAPLTGISLAITGPDAADFRFESQPAATLEATESGAIALQFIPGAAGPRHADLQISNSVGTIIVPLAGTGGSVFAPVFLSPADRPLNVTDYDFAGISFGGLTLGFLPPVGSSLIAIEKSGGVLAPLAGLPDQSGVTASFGGTPYRFIATYRAGDGNDLAFIRTGAGVPDPSFRPDPSSFLSAVALLPGGKSLVGGFFATVSGDPHLRLARVLPNGAADPSFTLASTAPPAGIAVMRDGAAIVCGTVSGTGGLVRANPARINATGALDAAFAPNVSGTVLRALELRDGRILIGGNFSGAGGISATNLALLHADGSRDTTFSASPSSGQGSTVSALAEQQDGKILIGGEFTRFNNVPTYYLARLNPNGAKDATFTTVVAPVTVGRGGVSAILAQPDGRIVIGGEFNSVNGERHLRIARLNSDGSLDRSFTTALDAAPSTILLQTDGKLLVTGGFAEADGHAMKSLVRLDPNGAIDPQFRSIMRYGSVGSAVLELSGSLLIADGFGAPGGIGGDHFARIVGDFGSTRLREMGANSVKWDRSGALPEIEAARLELSTNQGTTWTNLAAGTRTATGWTFAGLALPANGLLRASGREIVSTSASAVIAETRIIGASDFEEWRAARFGNPPTPASAALADPDNDGLANLLEFALGLDPLRDNSAAAPRWTFSGGRHVLIFSRPPGTVGVTYRAEWTTDLASGVWQPATDLSSAGVLKFEVDPAGRPRLFFRLAASIP